MCNHDFDKDRRCIYCGLDKILCYEQTIIVDYLLCGGPRDGETLKASVAVKRYEVVIAPHIPVSSDPNAPIPRRDPVRVGVYEKLLNYPNSRVLFFHED